MYENLKMNNIILPGCDDTNRGDQALIWETVRIGREAGYNGIYYMISTENCSKQSKKIGINQMDYILEHPSQIGTDKVDNRSYSCLLKLKWASVSIWNLLYALPLLFLPTRKIFSRFLGKGKKRTLEIFEQAEVAFVKGGGFLHSYGGITESYKIFFFLYHIKLAISMGIPVYVLPNSYGPFEGILVKNMLKNTLKKCKLVSSRESVSHDMLLEKCKIDTVISNDLAMYLEKETTLNLSEIFKQQNILIVNNSVAITVRPYRFINSSDASACYLNYKKSIVDFIVWLDSNGFYPVLVEHTFSEGLHEQDMICIKEITNMLQERIVCPIFSDLSLNCKEMKSVYSHFRYIVGTRFHSMIFSLTEGVPGIAITYGGNKGQGIMKDMGLEEYVIPIENINSDVLILKFKNMIENEKKIKNKIDTYLMNLLDDRRKIITMLKA